MPTTTPFANLITFSRGSNATVVGPDGLVQWAPNNLLTNSEQFDNANWTTAVGTATVTANTDVAPDGTTTADTFAATSVNATRWQTWVPVAGANYVFSVWIKRKSGSGNIQVTADASNFTTVAVTSSWQRFSVAFPNASAGTKGSGVRIVTSGDEVYVWGAQLELGTAATTYNPTTVKNLLGFSEAFDNAAWTKTDASIVTGAAANPINGLFNAQKLMENTANAVHLLGQAATLTATPYVFSIYAKAAERSWVQLRNASGTNQLAYFNLASGVAGTVGVNATASITAVGGGWYRCAIAFTAAAGSNTMHVRTATGDNVNSYTGDGNSGIYIYGAQLSDSASLDPYVPTPGAAPSSTAYYGPRFDYDPVTRAARGILIEEQRTNLATYSNDFTDASWVALGAKNLVANTNVSPDGSTNASTLTDNSAAAYQGIQKTVTVANDSTTYTASVYIRKTTGGTSPTFGINLQISGGTTVTVQPRLNTDTGALINGTGTVQNAGAYWRLTCSVTNNSTGNTSLGFSIYPATSSYNVPTDSSAATGSAIIYGAQLEAGAFATSYIPTIASTVTRSADVATITGQNFGQWYRQDEGCLVVEGSVYSTGLSGNRKTLAAITEGNFNNASRTAVEGATSAGASVISGGVTQAAFTVGSAVAANTPFKMALAMKANDFAFCANGGAVSTDTSGSVVSAPIVLDLGFGPQNSSGSTNTAGDQLNGWLRAVRFIPVRAADFQLQALTT